MILRRASAGLVVAGGKASMLDAALLRTPSDSPFDDERPRKPRSALSLVAPAQPPVALSAPTRPRARARDEQRYRHAMITYLREVRRHDVMSRDEEHEVAVRF